MFVALSGCALTADQSDISALQTAATQFKAANAGGAPAAAAARGDAVKGRLIQFVASGQIPPLATCVSPDAAREAFDADVAEGRPTVTVDWQALLKTPACTWGTNLQPDAPAPPSSQPIIIALNDYYAGVAGIASATSVQQVVDATTKASTAASSLAGLVPGAAVPAKAASALVDKLVQYGLQAAQYRALESVLGDVDPLLDQASGPIISALRVQQGYWISQTSYFVTDGVTALHNAFGAGGGPADRLALLQLSQPILDDLTAQQQAVRTDPGAAYQALVKAHHKLYAALKSNKGQFAGVLAAAEDIATSAQGMASAVAPTAPTAPATGSSPANKKG